MWSFENWNLDPDSNLLEMHRLEENFLYSQINAEKPDPKQSQELTEKILDHAKKTRYNLIRIRTSPNGSVWGTVRYRPIRQR